MQNREGNCISCLAYTYCPFHFGTVEDAKNRIPTHVCNGPEGRTCMFGSSPYLKGTCVASGVGASRSDDQEKESGACDRQDFWILFVAEIRYGSDCRSSVGSLAFDPGSVLEDDLAVAIPGPSFRAVSWSYFLVSSSPDYLGVSAHQD